MKPTLSRHTARDVAIACRTAAAERTQLGTLSSMSLVLMVSLLAGCGGGIDTELASAQDNQTPQLAQAADDERAWALNEANWASLAPSAAELEVPPPVAVAGSAPVETASDEAGPDQQRQAAPSVQSVRVDPADVLNEARASLHVGSQSWGNVQCLGSILMPGRVPAAGVQAASSSAPSGLRFGVVSEPASPSGRAFQLALHQADPMTASSYRCELSFAASKEKALPRDSAFWNAFSVKLPNLRSTTSEQSIAQWHAGDTSGGLLPIYTLLVRGDTMRLVLRYDTNANPNRLSTRALVLWSTNKWTPDTWLTFVTQARMSTEVRDQPFVRTWLNGQPIVNYSGPVGYKQPTVNAYPKFGLYHWVDATNVWDMRQPLRTMYLRHPVLIRDVNNRYNAAAIQSYVLSD